MPRTRTRTPHTHIAPKLYGGVIRIKLYGRLAPAIKQGLRDIAKAERKSMSWVVEEVLIEYFGLRRPRYLKAIRPALPKRWPVSRTQRMRLVKAS
jgi:hypothetical protein